MNHIRAAANVLFRACVYRVAQKVGSEDGRDMAAIRLFLAEETYREASPLSEVKTTSLATVSTTGTWTASGHTWTWN